MDTSKDANFCQPSPHYRVSGRLKRQTSSDQDPHRSGMGPLGMKRNAGRLAALMLLLALLSQWAELGTASNITTTVSQEEESPLSEELTTLSSSVEGGVTGSLGGSTLHRSTNQVNLIDVTNSQVNAQHGPSSKPDPSTQWALEDTTVVTKDGFIAEEVTSVAATKPLANSQHGPSSEASASTGRVTANTTMNTDTEGGATTWKPTVLLSVDITMPPSNSTSKPLPSDGPILTTTTVLVTSLPPAANPAKVTSSTTTPYSTSSTHGPTVTNETGTSPTSESPKALTQGSGDKMTMPSSFTTGKLGPTRSDGKAREGGTTTFGSTNSIAGALPNKKSNHWYIIIAVVLLALLILVVCFIFSVRRRRNTGSTSFQDPSKKKKKKGGEDAWAGPVQMPEENGVPVEVVDDDKDPSGKRLTLTTFFGKRKSRQCSVLLEDVTVQANKPAKEEAAPLLSQGANGHVTGGAKQDQGNQDVPPTAQEPKPPSGEKEASLPAPSNSQISAVQEPPQVDAVDPGDLPPPPSPPQVDFPLPPPAV